jgi:hypothetical protein
MDNAAGLLLSIDPSEAYDQISQQQMKISSDLGNRHHVTIDQLVMPAVELLEG